MGRTLKYSARGAFDRFSKQQIRAFKPRQIKHINARFFPYKNMQEAVQKGGWIKNLDHSIVLSHFPHKIGKRILKASLEQAVEKVIFKHLDKKRYDDLTFDWVTIGIRTGRRPGDDMVRIKFRKDGAEPELLLTSSMVHVEGHARNIPASKATERMMWSIYKDMYNTNSRVNNFMTYGDFSELVIWNFGD